jgi:hypothetical protein
MVTGSLLFQFRMSPQLEEQLRLEAERRGIRVQELARFVLGDYISQQKQLREENEKNAVSV